MFRVREALPLLMLTALILAGCGERTEEEPRERTAAGTVRVGDAVLTDSDLDNLLPEGERIPFTKAERKALVSRWIDTQILYQEARRRGLGEDPRIKARLRGLEQEYLADHLVFLELRERTEVTEEEIEEYFRIHEKEYMYEYRVSHILVNTLEEAEKVLELLKSRSFAWIANRNSVDPEAKHGGDLGYLTKGNMIPEFEEVIFDMKPGEVSGVIRSDSGYHVIKLVGMREAFVKVGLEDVREQIMNKLMIEKRKRAYKDLILSLRNGADVEFYDSSYVADTVRPDTVDTTEREEPDSIAG